MSISKEILNTRFEEETAPIDVIIHESNLENTKAYIAAVKQKTVDMKDLIARAAKKNNINALALYSSLQYIKVEILEAIDKGESINVMDLGILHPVLDSTVKDTGDTKDKSFSIRFSVSQEIQQRAKKLKIGSILFSNNQPVIKKIESSLSHKSINTEIEPKYFKSENTQIPEITVLGEKSILLLKGENLKILGISSGIYFTPVDSKNKEDKSRKYYTVEENQLIENFPKSIRFYMPKDIEKGRFILTVKTRYCKNGRLRKNAIGNKPIIVEVI